MVDKALRHNLAIALEDLKGILEKATVKKAQRRQSCTCPQCGHVDKKNRKTRDWVHCQSCDFAGPADNVAARNIASRAVINLPNAVIS
jgi:transposase